LWLLTCKVDARQNAGTPEEKVLPIFMSGQNGESQYQGTQSDRGCEIAERLAGRGGEQCVLWCIDIRMERLREQRERSFWSGEPQLG
jgi:hypothetical protein